MVVYRMELFNSNSICFSRDAVSYLKARINMFVQKAFPVQEDIKKIMNDIM
jgi:hypothetical protein